MRSFAAAALLVIGAGTADAQFYPYPYTNNYFYTPGVYTPGVVRAGNVVITPFNSGYNYGYGNWNGNYYNRGYANGMYYGNRYYNNSYYPSFNNNYGYGNFNRGYNRRR